MPQDYAQAVAWYARPPTRVRRAQINLGLMYYMGQGVPQDYAQAIVWYRKAADQGDANAQFNLGEMYRSAKACRRTMRRPSIWYPQGRRPGARHCAGQPRLDVRQRPRRAAGLRAGRRWYRKAADQGDAVAQFNLGSMYSKGQGVPQDYAQAVVWYRKAAEAGRRHAQFNLGTMYANGHRRTAGRRTGLLWYP